MSEIDLDDLKKRVWAAVHPIEAVDEKAVQSIPWQTHRTGAGQSLPPYYLVYFLFVDLLGFCLTSAPLGHIEVFA